MQYPIVIHANFRWLLKNFHDELPKLIQMAHAEPGERFLDIEVAELRCSETYHLWSRHCTWFLVQKGSWAGESKRVKYKRGKIWKGDQPKSMQSNNGKELIIYLPGLWEIPGQVCKMYIIHPDFQLFRQIYFPQAHLLTGLLKYTWNGHLSLKDSMDREWIDTKCSLWKSSESLKGCVHFAKAWHATGHTVWLYKEYRLEQTHKSLITQSVLHRLTNG